LGYIQPTAITHWQGQLIPKTGPSWLRYWALAEASVPLRKALPHLPAFSIGFPIFLLNSQVTDLSQETSYSRALMDPRQSPYQQGGKAFIPPPPRSLAVGTI
jgi:hypothetical protein